MTTFLAAARSISLDLGGDEDTADKLSCRYTVSLLIVFCVVISTKQYVGDPIVCWVPATYTASMRDYTDNMCWIKNTYYVPVGDVIPSRDEDIRASSEINYYQWVPIVLVIQALLFYCPSLAWHTLNHRAGCDIKSLCRALGDSSMVNAEVREKVTQSAAKHLDAFLRSKRKRADVGGGLLGRCCSYACRSARYGNSMVLLYGCVKLLYIANVVGQIFLLNAFIGDVYANYGLDVLRTLVGGTEATESAKFPRSTLCSFKVREFGGNVHRHTVQCVLPINLFNEKIYIFLWFWFVFVAFVSTASFVGWSWYFATRSRISFCKEMLTMTGLWSPPGRASSGGGGRGGGRRRTSDEEASAKLPLDHDSKPRDGAAEYAASAERAERVKKLRDFANHYLRSDGIFILRLLRTNVNELIVSEITSALYRLYERNPPEHDGACDDGDDDDPHTA